MSRGDGLARLRRALEEHGCTVHGNSAQCPGPDHANGDRRTSLSIGEGDDDCAVLNCHLGCHTDTILEVLGMSAADLYDEPRAGGRGYEVTAEYRYTDEHGHLLFVKERHVPKDFRLKRPDGRGGWAWGLGDTRRVLYNLPAVLAAIAAGQPVYIAEREKDADAIGRSGAVATCNFEGAAKDGQRPKWRPEYGDVLEGATVIVVADRDPAGYAHADAVRADLAGKAASVIVVEAAAGKDAADHLAAGHSLAELVPAASEHPQPGDDPFAWAHIIDWDEAFGARPAEVGWLIEPLLEAGTLNAWFGKPAAWKSLIALEASAGLAAGRGVLGQPAGEPVTVVYVDVENAVNDIVERLQAFGYSPGDLKRLVYSSFPDLPALDTVAGGLRLLRLAESAGAALVIIDTTSRVIAGKENDADTFLQLYRNTLIPLKQRGITVLRLDHPGKDADRGQRGSSAKDGDVDTVWHVDRVSDTEVNFERRKSRSGHGDGRLYLVRSFDPLRHSPGGTGIPPKVADLVDALRMNVPPGAGITNKRAGEILHRAGERFRTADLARALRIWRETLGNAETP